MRKDSIVDRAGAWREAIESIADPARSPAYNGLSIEPQLGLVPLGPDPDSGLWEFAHLATGRPPERGGEGGLVIEEESGVVLTLLPGGTFLMGSQNEHPDRPNFDPQEDAFSPVHQVTLDPFFISKYELTRGQWLRMTGGIPRDLGATLVHPVAALTWRACGQVLPRYMLDLPTEAQWEYACRAGTDSAFFFGDDERDLVLYANIEDQSRNRELSRPIDSGDQGDAGQANVAAVGTLRPNPFGLHDTLGNLAEICRDWRVPYSAPARGGDGLRAGVGDPVILWRGGTYAHGAGLARPSVRTGGGPDDGGDLVGVRPVTRVQGTIGRR